MKIVGLIAEYNPFHNGHQYHIAQAKKITNADYVIVVMSGNFVQRGEPAIMPKHLRASMALQAGADLVIELPVCYACGSAEYFAYGAVSLLEQLGCVDALCFGSECGNIDDISKLAQILSEEPGTYRQALQSYLKQGFAFPAARQKAIAEHTGNNVLSSILEFPNNTLGIEYLKALHRLQSKIEPVTITRLGAGYHDTDLQEQFSSASAIRRQYKEQSVPESFQAHVPEYVSHLCVDSYQKRFPLFANDFSLLLRYRLQQETATSLTHYFDVSDELANRIIRLRNQFVSWEQFCDLLKTKELTYARISRALLHILLGLKKGSVKQYIDHAHFYAHVLGFRTESTVVLKEIKHHASIPLLTKLTATDSFSETGKNMLQNDIFAADLYEMVVTERFQFPFQNEYEQQIVRI